MKSGTPQGAALSPLYFAIFIASIADCVDQELEEQGEMTKEAGKEKKDRELANILSLLFADVTKLASSLKSNKEMGTLKNLLSRIYRWVEENKMMVNAGKTEFIRFGRLPIEDEGYKTPDGKGIKKVSKVKDLGITFQEDATFKLHIADVKTRAINMLAWLLRTFNNRSLGFMRFLYRTYIVPITDYCSQLYTPVRFSEIDTLESIPRAWTRRCHQIKGHHFWDRLKMLGISSIQRRQERFRINLTWKIIEGIIPHYGGIESVWRPYKGRMLLEKNIKESSKAKSVQEASFRVQAARLWNSLPKCIRDYRTADGGTLEGFKRSLGAYLQCIPDLPRDQAGGWMPDPKDSKDRHSNSLYHWRPYIQRNFPQKAKDLEKIVLNNSYGVPGGMSQEGLN